jgi:hypothetical protein
MAGGPSSELVWYRAECDGGACIEVAKTGDAVILRSSANPGDTSVTLSRAEWEGFLAGAKEGVFDSV